MFNVYTLAKWLYFLCVSVAEIFVMPDQNFALQTSMSLKAYFIPTVYVGTKKIFFKPLSRNFWYKKFPKYQDSDNKITLKVQKYVTSTK